MKDLGTLIPALVTPLRPDGSVDPQRAGELADRLVQRGCDGVLVSGTTGESPTLSDEEKLAVLAAVREAVGDRVFVWAGTGSNDTAHSCELSREAVRAGADGLLLVAPYYNKPTQEGLYRHFRRIAETTDRPVMLYNIPGRTGCNVEPATVARLARDVPQVVAVKEASLSLDQATEVLRLAPPGFRLYCGEDALTLPLLSVGAVGVVSVVVHLVPERMRALLDAYQHGDTATAARLHRELYPLCKAMFAGGNPPAVKRALQLIGFDCGGHRLPLVPPSPAEEAVLERALRAAGLLPADAQA